MIIFDPSNPQSMPRGSIEALQQLATEGDRFIRGGSVDGYIVLVFDLAGLGECEIHLPREGWSVIAEGICILRRHAGLMH